MVPYKGPTVILDLVRGLSKIRVLAGEKIEEIEIGKLYYKLLYDRVV
jgi:hypothetical protein